MIKIFSFGEKKIGYGHVSRSKSLFEYLTKKKIKVSLEIFNSNNLLEYDFNSISNDIKVIVIDCNNYSDFILKRLNNKFITVTLDHFGNLKSDYNYVIFEHKKAVSKIKSFIGYQYIIIRDEFLKLKKKNSKNKHKILISIGGSDIKNYGLKILELFDKNKFEITLVLGPYNNNQIKSEKIKIYRNPKKFNYLLNESDFVICNGGSTMFESLFLNKKTFILPQTKFEKALASDLFKKKLITGYGYKDLSKNGIVHYIEMPIVLNKIIDGRGLERISEFLSKLT